MGERGLFFIVNEGENFAMADTGAYGSIAMTIKLAGVPVFLFAGMWGIECNRRTLGPLS